MLTEKNGSKTRVDTHSAIQLIAPGTYGMLQNEFPLGALTMRFGDQTEDMFCSICAIRTAPLVSSIGEYCISR
jgi:hypothetical protein